MGGQPEEEDEQKDAAVVRSELEKIQTAPQVSATISPSVPETIGGVSETCVSVSPETSSVSETSSTEPQPVSTNPAATDTSPADVPSEKTPKRRSLVSLLCRLLSDVMLVGIILSTVLGVVHNAGKEVTRSTAPPVPFFTRSSYHRVKDYFNGDVFKAFTDVADFENALFMYYAPWDRASQEARQQLMKVAKFFSHTDVAVVAVNCWYPTSDCAKEFGNKSLSTPFPMFIFYPGQQKGVQYRGQVRADQLIRWVQHCRYPLTHLHSASHLSSLQTSHPSLLLGYLPHTTTVSLDPSHTALLTTALALLEVHPDRSLGVAVTMDPVLAMSLRLGVSQPVRLLTWNSSIAFPNKTVDSDRLLVWALRQDSQAAPWLRLPGRKSMVLQRTLAQHTLLVFTGKKALEAISHTASTVRRVASAYKDCLASPLVTSYRSALSQSPTTVHSSDCGDCQESTRCTLSSWSDSSRPLPVCQYVASNRSCDSLGWAGYTYDEAVGLLIKEEARERSQQPPVEGWHGEDKESRVAGLGCDTNRTLGIFLVDNQKYSSLLYSLGLESGWEGGVILSPTEESVIADQGGVTESALEDLVISWHSGTRVTRPGLRSTHHTGGFIRMGRETPSPAPGPVVPPLCDPAMGGSCLAELDTHSLKSLVLGASSPGAVVFYTSPFCTHCTVVSHVFHTVQRILRPLDHLGLRFHTVDATRNDLPVQFTALSYPTVLVFPEHRKAESRLFPVGKELNTTNLLTFIVSNLSPSTRLRLALSSCSLTCLTKLRLSASAAIARLGNIAMRRPGLARRRSYQRRLKYNKTVLYVVTAWSASKSAIPRVSESFVAAILESFKEVSKR